MDDIFVARLMSSELKTVSPDTLVEDAAELMIDNDIGSVLVVDENNGLEGILTSTDFVSIVSERKPKDRTPVSSYMSSDVVTTTAQTPIEEAADLMLEQGVHHLPVVDETEGVIGIITTTDLTTYVARLQSRPA
ncbi:CBS domain-containing protein [Natronomonas amylolytica]|uniref:CBS domain-containing protein n=1 Tax=Natronomonas amylolytica TaxID=3108498 RepID=UPI00300A6F14